MLAAMGYAWQGRPALAGQGPQRWTAAMTIDPETLAWRDAMFGRFGTSGRYFIPSDALMRFGAPVAAAQFVLGGINDEPGNPALWVQLGIVIAANDRAVSPAAAFAFRRAIALAPNEPGPPFLLGLAYVNAGEFERARTAWARALALASGDSGYRPGIAERLMLLDALLAHR